jgi:hypothetical protein
MAERFLGNGDVHVDGVNASELRLPMSLLFISRLMYEYGIILTGEKPKKPDKKAAPMSFCPP